MSCPHIAVYVRVSSTGQDLAAQEPELQSWLSAHAAGRPVVWYRDTFTGATFDRPAMQQLDVALSASQVCVVLVWRLDRLGRTAPELLPFLKRLDDTGIEFVSLRDGFDHTTPSGRLLRTILAGFAEYEREVITERILAGIAKAKASGKRWGGRKPGLRPTLTDARLNVIRALLAARTPKAEIARQLQISRSTVYTAIALLNRPASPAPSTSRKRISP